MKRPILGMLLVTTSYGAIAQLPGRAVSVTATVEIYEHPGPLHHRFTKTWALPRYQQGDSTYPQMAILDFDPGHTLVSIERLYTPGRGYDVHNNSPILQGPGDDVNEAHINLQTRPGRGVIHRVLAGPVMEPAKWADLSGSRLYCQTAIGPYMFKDTSTTTGSREIWGDFTTMYYWSPASNESNYIKYSCKIDYVADPVSPSYVRFEPDTLNLYGVVGGPGISGKTELVIGTIGHDYQARLVAHTPPGVTLTRDGYPSGAGFNNDPAVLHASGTRIGVTVTVTDSSAGSRLYSVPVDINYD